jgi:hypothetical protein
VPSRPVCGLRGVSRRSSTPQFAPRTAPRKLSARGARPGGGSGSSQGAGASYWHLVMAPTQVLRRPRT